MNHSRVIVDSYAVSSGQTLPVRGRYNSVSSTETDIERSFRVTLERTTALDVYRDGFELASEPGYDHLEQRDINNVGPIKINTRKNAINRTIQSLKYQPSGSNNSYECLPKEQSVVLPYLVGKVPWDNMNFTQPVETALVQVRRNDFVRDVFYDPSYFGNMVISTRANPQLFATTPNNVSERSVVRRDLVQLKMR